MYLGSVTRTTGLSGIDTESMVKQIMDAEKLPLIKMQQNRTKLEWKRDAYREMTTLVKAFNDTYFDQVKRDTYMLGSAMYNKYSVTKSDSNLGVTPGSGTIPGTHNIVVDQVATSAQVQSSGDVVFDTSQKLADLGFTVGQTITIKANGNTANFDITADKTLAQLITEVNSNTGLNVRFSYSTFTDRFTLQSKATGVTDNATFSISSTDNFVTLTKLDNVTHGQNAIIDYDTTLNYQSTSNTITIDGVSYDVSKVTNLGANISVQFSQDVDAVVDGIKKFMSDYNSLIDVIYAKLDQTPERKYLPLTDEQKEEMKDKDIELWETKAKTGLLYNDELLKKLAYQMRSVLYKQADTSAGAKALYNIGITTDEDPKNHGKLIIKEKDEAKLKQAISENPTMVQELFTKDNNGTNDGVLIQLKNKINDAIRVSENANKIRGYLVEKAGQIGNTSEVDNDIYKELQRMNRKIEDFQMLLYDKENSYYQKFSRLESMIQQANSQSSWLSQQFS